jgi:CheY-like chemotaxis protein
MILSKNGHTFQVFNNGKEFYDSFVEGAFNFILMDIQMPIMDGIVCSEKLKFNFKDVPPIIAITANASEESLLSSALDEYISKPASITKINEKIIKYLK